MAETPSVRRADTRQHPRYEVSIPVDCSTRQFFFSNQACNISKGGLFIRSDKPLPLNAEISLVLRLPGTDRSLFATGRVIWNGDVEKGIPQIVPGSGIRFVGMTASDRAALESYLAGLTPAPTRLPTPN
jgi:type IV pilus assembly protein PilZ